MRVLSSGGTKFDIFRDMLLKIQLLDLGLTDLLQANHQGWLGTSKNKVCRLRILQFRARPLALLAEFFPSSPGAYSQARSFPTGNQIVY